MEHSLKSLMAEKLGGAKKPSSKAKLHMHIHKMDDGKYLMEHHMRGGSEPTSGEPTQHAAVNMKELISHIGKHFGDGDESHEASEPPTEAAAEPQNV